MYKTLLTTSIIIRLFIPNNFLNMFYDYTSSGGVIVGKIHPGTYFLLIMAACNLFNNHRRLLRYERGPLIGCLFLTFCVLFILVFQYAVGRLGAGASALIDTMLAAVFTTVALLGLKPESRCSIASITIKLLLLNSLLVVIEFVGKFHFIPTFHLANSISGEILQEEVFRPAGLLNHPLNVGLLNLTAIPFVALGRGSFLKQIFTIASLATGILACNVRLATILLIPVILTVSIFAVARAVRKGHNVAGYILVVSTIVLALMPLCIWAAWSIGFFERFERQGLFDESANSRVAVWRILNNLTPEQTVYGLPAETINELVPALTDFEIVETSLLAFILMFGYQSAALIVAGVATFILLLTWRAPALGALGALVFLAASLGTIVLSSKSMCLTMLTVLLIGSRPAGSDIYNPLKSRPRTYKFKVSCDSKPPFEEASNR
jgi:hypothetical protein